MHLQKPPVKRRVNKGNTNIAGISLTFWRLMSTIVVVPHR